jgi:hypothetical protein
MLTPHKNVFRGSSVVPGASTGASDFDVHQTMRAKAIEDAMPVLSFARILKNNILSGRLEKVTKWETIIRW